jgi:hypothetical protein
MRALVSRSDAVDELDIHRGGVSLLERELIVHALLTRKDFYLCNGQQAMQKPLPQLIQLCGN